MTSQTRCFEHTNFHVHIHVHAHVHFLETYDMHLAAMLFEPGRLIGASLGDPNSIKIWKNEPKGGFQAS